MMYLLPRWISPERFEPPHGCMLRLAERNGLPGMLELRLLTGLSISKIMDGRDLDKLAALLHCDPTVLDANAIIRRNNARAIVGGHTMRPSADFTPLSVRRACPSCVKEAPYHRAWWDWSFVSTCPWHECLLVDECTCGGKLSWQDGSPFKCRECDGGDIRISLNAPVDARLTAPDRWAIDRYIGQERQIVELIDDAPLGHAAELIKRVGVLHVHGYQPTYPKMSDPATVMEVRARGYELLAAGGIQDVLQRAFDGYLLSAPGPYRPLKHLYGWFYSWFINTGGVRLYPRMAAAISRHSKERIQVTRRAFGGLLPPEDNSGERNLTLSEASQLAKVRTQTMRLLLSFEGLIRPEKLKGAPVSVGRDVAERIARDIAEAFSLTSLETYLGLRRIAMIKLVRSGMLPYWVGGAARYRYLFRKRQIIDWLNDLLGDAPVANVAPPATVALADVPQAFKIDTVLLFEAVKRRDISIVAMIEVEPRLRNAFVRVDDVARYKATRVRETPALSRSV
ncbi:TniQ family protein [Bradyrhizobium sp. LB11.1]|uniref:TniQ family protein n=1 Tax=Bradyrhizobium sp. LB11.1 TaxID=3156326 RepID=UPI00339668EC